MAQTKTDMKSADKKKDASSSTNQFQPEKAFPNEGAAPKAAAPLPQGLVHKKGTTTPAKTAPKAAAPSPAPIAAKATPLNAAAKLSPKAAPPPRPEAAAIMRPVQPSEKAEKPQQQKLKQRPVAPEVTATAEPVKPRTPKAEEPRLTAGPARQNPSLSDAKPSIGGLIYALNAKPSDKPYKTATIFSVIWFIIGGLLGWVAVGQKIGDFEAISDVAYTPAAFIIAACILIPIAMAWMLATLAVRAQEMKLMASAMTEVAIRLAEPDKMAEQKVASVGQTIRRQVSSMDDAISQSIDRAGELEAKVNDEVAALERSYNRNETMMKGLIAELAAERQSLLEHGKEVVSAIGQVGHLVDQKLLKSSGEVAQALARKSAEAAHKLHQANEVVTSKLENINQQVTDNIPAMMDKLVSEQARLDKVVVSADTSLKNLHGNLANQTNLLAKQSTILTNQSDTLKAKTDELGKSLKEQTDRMDEVIDTHSKKMNKSLTQRVLALDASLVQRAKAIDLTLENRTKTLNASLTEKAKNIDLTFENRTKTLDASLAEKAKNIDLTLENRTKMLNASLTEKAQNIDNSLTKQTSKLVAVMDSKASSLDAALGQKTTALDAALGQKTAAMDKALAEKARSMDAAIGQRMIEMNQKLDNTTRKMSDSLSDHVATLDQSLGEKAVSMDAAFSQKARALDASLENKAKMIDKSLTDRIAQIDSSMSQQANAMSATLGLQTSKMKQTLDDHSSTIESSLLAQTNLLDKTLSINNQAILDQNDQFSSAALAAENAATAAQNQKLEAEKLQQQAEQQAQQQAAEQQAAAQATQQAQKLEQSSLKLMNNIKDLTQAFERQGIALLDDAKTIEAAIVQGSDNNPNQNLQELTDKASKLDETKLLFTQQMQQALAQTQQEARSVKQTFASDPSFTGQQKLQDIQKLEETAKQQTERAVAKLQDNFVLVSQQVNMSVDNANQHQAHLSQTSTASSYAPSTPQRPTKSRKKSKNKSSWSMGDLLSSSLNRDRDPDTPTYKPASSSQGAAQGSVSIDPLDVLRIDEIARAIDAPTATNAWLRYQNGERNVFTRNLYNDDGQLTFDRIQGRYQTDMSFRDTVERYVQDYEALLSEAENNDPTGQATSGYLTTETGRVYLMLAHISGRLG